MPRLSTYSQPGSISSEILRGLLVHLAIKLGVSVETSRIQQSLSDAQVEDRQRSFDEQVVALMRAGQAIGIRLVPVELDTRDAWQLLLDHFSIAVVQRSENKPTAWVFSNESARRCEGTRIDLQGHATEAVSKSNFARILAGLESPVFFVGQPLLVCQRETSFPELKHNHQLQPGNHHHDSSDDHHSISPQWRMFRFLKFERTDIWSLVVFGFVVGVLDLATPLAVEQMVTTIGFASFSQPLIWLAILLFGILTLSASIKGLQFFIVEILQRRLFVRVVGDLSERFPRIERAAIDGVHGPELANRFFDVMTMQKATASLLVDGLSLVIQTLTGLLLLALYSPFLLAFDIVLVLAMSVVLYLLGRNAVRTAIEESLVKYRVAHWLQDVIGNATAFQVHGGTELSVDRANRLTVDYLVARKKHFHVLMRQTLFALILYAVSVSALLSLGVWLVLSGSLSIGQLVASVSVVVVVVGAFAKIGKSLESFYDLMSAVDKVGHLIDLPTLPPSRPLDAGQGPVAVRFQSLHVGTHHGIEIGSLRIEEGKRVAIICDDGCRSMLMQTLCGLRSPWSGSIEIGGIDSREVNRFAAGSMVAIASNVEIFHGTFLENISMGRVSVNFEDVREALALVGLWDEALALSNGIETILQSGGFPLNQSQAIRLCIARAIVNRPRLLLLDGALDPLPTDMRKRVWESLSDSSRPWTIIVSSHDASILQSCDSQHPLAGTVASH